MNHFKALILLIFSCSTAWGQDLGVANRYLEQLSSAEFSGRGYINKGDSLAADYIRDQFVLAGLQPLTSSHFQQFEMPINTIAACKLQFDGVALKAGYDYMVGPASPSVDLEGKVFPVSNKMLHSPTIAKKVKKAVRKGMIPVIAAYDRKDSLATAAITEIKKCSKSDALIFLKPSLTWTLSRSQDELAEIWLLDSVYNPYTTTFSLQIEAKFLPQYTSQNVCSFVPGTVAPDSFIIMCGHYDHLGKMGDATFYGANDNASGISMLMEMAHYFAQNPQRYSILFIAFAGEEAGLIGSHHFVTNPPEGFDLGSLKFVFNMDLMGNGQDGATIVNGKVFQEHYQEFVEVNEQHHYLPAIKSRGKAANSDHYFFGELGIPSFFIYTMGPYLHYHVPQDNADNLDLGPSYLQTFKLIRDFIIELNGVN